MSKGTEKVRDLLAWAGKLCVSSSKTELIDLLSSASGLDRNYLYLESSKELDAVSVRKFRSYVKELQSEVPVPYITGRSDFMGLELEVNNTVLIPRPETELLVEAVIEASHSFQDPQILDIGTGSGNIAIALARFIKAEVTAVDIELRALEMARRNARKNNCLNKIKFIRSDLFSSLSGSSVFDIIVSNPPYINDLDFKMLDKSVLYEPETALRGGKDGLYVLRKILTSFKKFIKKDGMLFIEISYDQYDTIEELLSRVSDVNFEFIKDYSNINRIVKVRYEG